MVSIAAHRARRLRSAPTRPAIPRSSRAGVHGPACLVAAPAGGCRIRATGSSRRSASIASPTELTHRSAASMNWFVTLNEAAFRAERYVELFKVAVHTAQTRTSLVPHLLYDGSETAVVRWARRRGVRVLQVRSFLYDRLAAIRGGRG